MQEPTGTLPSPARARVRTSIVGAAAAAIALLHVLSLQGVVPVDDDYIVYRYARNWVEHGVYAFNLADGPTDGVTTPLWLLIASVGVALGSAPEIWSPALGAASMVGTVLLLARIGRAALPPAWAWFPAVLFTISPTAAWHARAGLGTLPMAFVTTLALERLLAFRAGKIRAWQVGLALAAAVLFRLEGVLVVLAAGVAMRRSMGTFWPALALPAAAGALVCVWRWRTFGHWLPAAGALKALPLPVELEYGTRYLMRSLGEGAAALWLAVGALAVFLAGGLRKERLEQPAVFTGLSCALALIFVLLVGGDWMVYSRLMVPFLPLALVGAALVLAHAASVTSRATWLGWASAAALVAATCWGFAARPQAAFENRFFERWWLDVGVALREGVAPEARVALSPIGAVGWRSRLPIVDVLGLTHGAFRDIAPDLEGVGVKGHHRHSADWVFSQRPDYVILGNGILQPDTGQVAVNPWEADIALDPRFQRDYVQDRRDVKRTGGGSAVLPYLRLRAAPRIR